MGIGSWFKKWRKSEDETKIDEARDEFFDTPEEQRIQSQDITGMQADTQAGMLYRGDVSVDAGSADAEERLDEEAGR
jgi:hypothetical protein